MACLQRIALVLLILWLPFQAVAGELLHAHEALAAQEIDHLTHDGNAIPGDNPATCSDCAIAHGFCHLVLNPGIVSLAFVAFDDAAAARYLLTPVAPLVGLDPDSLDRPPLPRA